MLRQDVGRALDAGHQPLAHLAAGDVREDGAVGLGPLLRRDLRVDALVRVCDQLQDENRSLKQRQDVLTSERATLLQKNEQVRARVEAMIGRLKAMEQGS